MSFIGKVLVVVQVMLSICFMAFAGAVSATHVNWRTRVDSLNQSLTVKNTELTNLQAEMKKVQDTVAAQLAEKEREVGDLRVKNLQLTGDLDTLTDKYNSLSESEKVKTAIAAITVEDAQARNAEALRLRELYRNALAAKDEEYKKKMTLEDQNFELNVELGNLKNEQIVLLQNNKTLKDALVSRGLPTEVDEYQLRQAPPPSIAGEILATRPGQGAQLVEISVGSDDGLSKGHELFVYRLGDAAGNSKYLGKIKIEYTSPDRAVGTVLDRAKNGTIEKGDNVSSKL